MEEEHKVLIIKTGYSEFLEGENNSRRVSYGDVLRITPILHLYENDHVTWVADPLVFPLLEGIPHIDRLLPYDFTTAEQLKTEHFDTMINLEKIPGICVLANKIDAWNKRGFRFDTKTETVKAYHAAFEVLGVSTDPKNKKTNKRTTQELLFEMVGAQWKGEDYLLGYQPTNQEEYDIALNNHIGPKWPTKAWPRERWDELEKHLEDQGLTVTTQDEHYEEMINDLRKYMDWINSAKMVVTSDSLGTHLGLALKKKVIGLFGPTPHREYHFYDRGVAITPDPYEECMPCFRPECEKGITTCMQNIPVDKVLEKINQYL